LETIVKKLYEGMFLVDAAEAAADWGSVETNIRNILEKAEAEIISLRKWDERKLAYEINKKSRGTYILCYFRADGRRISDIERDVQLSEQIMRVLILCAEHITQEDIEKDTPITRAEKENQKAVEAAAEKTKAEQVNAQGSSEKMQDEMVEVHQEAAGESGETEQTAEKSPDEEHSVTAEPAAADVSESEQTEKPETENGPAQANEEAGKETDDKL